MVFLLVQLLNSYIIYAKKGEKMIDLGKKESYGPECAMEAAKESPNKIHYPSFSIYDRDLPLSEDVVGKTITISLKVKVTRAGKQVTMNKDKKKVNGEYSFDIMAIDMPKANKMSNKASDGSAQSMIEDELEGMSKKKKG
jgi:hypothetical protein